MNHRLHASHLTLGYDHKIIADDLSVAILDGAFTVIVGPNACGKSTLLRALCRLLKPSAGEVFLDGKSISCFAIKALARELGLLPQT